MDLKDLKVAELVNIKTRYKEYFGVITSIEKEDNYVFIEILKEKELCYIDINIDKVRHFNTIKIVSL